MENFSTLHPSNGHVTALIALGLETFLASVETNPALATWCHSDIMQHLYNEEKEKDNHAVAIRIPTPLYERFVVLFPEFGATTWFMRRLINAYLDEATPMRDVVAAALDSIYARNDSPVTSLK